MKITNEDYAYLSNRLKPLDTPERRALYLAKSVPNADRVKNWDMRYRWDLLWAARIKIGDGAGVKGDIDLYSYLTDDHIDTALRSIVPPLESGLVNGPSVSLK